MSWMKMKMLSDLALAAHCKVFLDAFNMDEVLWWSAGRPGLYFLPCNHLPLVSLQKAAEKLHLTIFYLCLFALIPPLLRSLWLVCLSICLPVYQSVSLTPLLPHSLSPSYSPHIIYAQFSSVSVRHLLCPILLLPPSFPFFPPHRWNILICASL